MTLDSILGQDVAVQTLRQALASGTVHHAYRFEGPDGVGKERTALALASALFCEKKPNVGCGTCHHCDRIARFSPTEPRVPLHPDVILLGRGIYPAGTIGRSRAETSEISVDQIRTLVLERLAYSPHEAKARVFIIRAAEELSISAANALLKTLEEPPKENHFILLTSASMRLLDTIRSRSLGVRFRPLDTTVLLQIAQSTIKVPPDVLQDAAARAQGSMTRLQSFLNPDASEQGDFARTLETTLRSGSMLELIQMAEKIERKSLKQPLLEMASRWGQEARAKLTKNPAETLTLARGYARVLSAVRALDRNASASLTLIELGRSLREISRSAAHAAR